MPRAFMILPASGSVPSISNLAFTCALYALIGYSLARLRWWAGLPFLFFLAITLAATFKRLGDFRAAGALPSAFTPNYLALHSLTTAVAAAVIIFGMRQQRLRHRVSETVEILPPAV